MRRRSITASPNVQAQHGAIPDGAVPETRRSFGRMVWPTEDYDFFGERCASPAFVAAFILMSFQAVVTTVPQAHSNGADLTPALAVVPLSLGFVARWAGAAARCPQLRAWLAQGSRRTVRQRAAASSAAKGEASLSLALPPREPLVAMALRRPETDEPLGLGVEAGSDASDAFTLVLIEEAISGARVNRQSLHLPRTAARAGPAGGHWATRALLNVVNDSGAGVGASLRGARSLAASRAGPPAVTGLSDVRPVTHAGELECLFDARWLAVVRDPLGRYTGQWKAGGRFRFDAVPMAAGALMAPHGRRAGSLGALAAQADLRRGCVASTGRGGKRRASSCALQGCWAAGGSLLAHRCVTMWGRLGPLVAPAVALLEFGATEQGVADVCGGLTQHCAELLASLAQGWAAVAARCNVAKLTDDRVVSPGDLLPLRQPRALEMRPRDAPNVSFAESFAFPAGFRPAPCRRAGGGRGGRGGDPGERRWAGRRRVGVADEEAAEELVAAICADIEQIGIAGYALPRHRKVGGGLRAHFKLAVLAAKSAAERLRDFRGPASPPVLPQTLEDTYVSTKTRRPVSNGAFKAPNGGPAGPAPEGLPAEPGAASEGLLAEATARLRSRQLLEVDGLRVCRRGGRAVLVPPWAERAVAAEATAADAHGPSAAAGGSSELQVEDGRGAAAGAAAGRWIVGQRRLAVAGSNGPDRPG
ncbi:unnamed protein product [Prorocentrum cordatum]|uniref:Uncharacterized protein n=1 Tax=Prorocentrum cordatum TaxID=2364126 RepID=A0ABN9XDD7_9DINO|nr:unnamed protein product [Polarella glacialis]